MPYFPACQALFFNYERIFFLIFFQNCIMLLFMNTREKLLERLKMEVKASRIMPVAERIGMSHVTLWRICKDKSKGNTANWDKIFTYYKK